MRNKPQYFIFTLLFYGKFQYRVCHRYSSKPSYRTLCFQTPIEPKVSVMPGPGSKCQAMLNIVCTTLWIQTYNRIPCCFCDASFPIMIYMMTIVGRIYDCKVWNCAEQLLDVDVCFLRGNHTIYN